MNTQIKITYKFVEMTPSYPVSGPYIECFSLTDGHGADLRALDVTHNQQDITWQWDQPSTLDQQFLIVFQDPNCYKDLTVMIGKPYLFWNSPDPNPWGAVQSLPGATGATIILRPTKTGSTSQAFTYSILPFYCMTDGLRIKGQVKAIVRATLTTSSSLQ